MNYTIDCRFRNKQGREVGFRMPLWKGEASSPSAAVNRAHEVLKASLPLPTGTSTIALTIKGEDGSMASATEFAEDVEIGRGASAIGSSGLLCDGINHELSDEQVEEAHKRIRDMAIAALPEAAQKILDKAREDAFEGFFGELDPEGKRKAVATGARTSVGVSDGDEDFRAVVDRVSKAQDGALGGGVGGSPAGGNQPRHSGAYQPSVGGGPAGGIRPDFLEQLREMKRSMEKQTGRAPNRIVVSRRQYDFMQRELDKQALGGKAQGSKLDSIYGMPIDVIDDPNAPPLQSIRPPRKQPDYFTVISHPLKGSK